MTKRTLIGRTKIIISFIVILVVCFTVYITFQSITINSVNIQTPGKHKSVLSEAVRKSLIQGSIVDRKGRMISHATRKGEDGKLTDAPAYSYLIGYNHPIYGSYALKSSYEDYLYLPDKHDTGATVRLTTDNRIQAAAYNLIRGSDASIVVLEKSSGRILALASSKEQDFDANKVNESNMKRWNASSGFFLQNGYRDLAEPGSVFKVVTASALIDANKDRVTVKDAGKVTLDGHSVVNAGKQSYGTLRLQEAIGVSSNVYFATQGVALGARRLEKTAQKFYAGKSIALDFTTLTSHLDLSKEPVGVVADTAFGQGKTLLTPLHIAMVFQTIGNGGIMNKPYLVEQISAGKKSLYTGKSKVMKECISQATAKKVDEMLYSTANDYYGIHRYGIRAKTGTAQLADGKVKCYMATYNSQYVVVASKKAEGGYGIDLKPLVLKLYAELEKNG